MLLIGDIELFHLEDRDGISLLRFDHGKASALDLEFLDGLDVELERFNASAARALVLTGTGTIFSAGVDLFRLTKGGADYVSDFLPALNRTFLRLFDVERPVVAAINGHAIAGGCIIAMAADHRIMAEGEGRIGIPELRVGVPFPTVPLEIARFAIPPLELQEIVYGAGTFDATEARLIGLVDDLEEPKGLLDQAMSRARSYAEIPAASFAMTKRQLRHGARQRMVEGLERDDEKIREIWSNEETLAAVRAYLDRTVRKKS